MLKTVQPDRSRLILIIGLLISLVVLSFSAGFFTNRLIQTNNENFPILTEAITLLEKHALKPLPANKELEYGMIRGMLQSVNDPYTTFQEPPQHELQSNQLDGKFGGISVRLERDTDNHVRLYPLPNSPGLDAGIKDGDWLVSVDDLSVNENTSLEEIQAAIRGPIGERVSIQVWRAGEDKPLTFSIKRIEIAAPSVTFNLSSIDSRVGVIQISIIAATTPTEVKQAFDQLTSKGAEYFVLDLRNNGGGLVEAGVDVCRLFLDTGDIIYEQYRNSETVTYQVQEIGPLATVPLSILVNQNSASAAEIIAGVLQSKNRASLIGNRTYGKDSVQLVYTLSDNSSIHITTGQWWVAGGSPELEYTGIQPDILLTEEETNGAQALQRAVDFLIP